MSGMKETMKTKKKKWGRYALPTGFTERRYPKVLSYHTTSKNMMGRRNPNYGYQIIFSKNTRGLKGNSNAKLVATPHWRIMVLVKQATRRFHRKLGRDGG
jgi:hypothetical protein